MLSTRTYDVHLHANRRLDGHWLRYRTDGYVFYPMEVTADEFDLRHGRFANFRYEQLKYRAAITYNVLFEGEPFRAIIEWIDDLKQPWNFTIEPKPLWFDRPCFFSFDDHETAVAFTLRWSS